MIRAVIEIEKRTRNTLNRKGGRKISRPEKLSSIIYRAKIIKSKYNDWGTDFANCIFAVF